MAFRMTQFWRLVACAAGSKLGRDGVPGKTFGGRENLGCRVRRIF